VPMATCNTTSSCLKVSSPGSTMKDWLRLYRQAIHWILMIHSFACKETEKLCAKAKRSDGSAWSDRR